MKYTKQYNGMGCLNYSITKNLFVMMANVEIKTKGKIEYLYIYVWPMSEGMTKNSMFYFIAISVFALHNIFLTYTIATYILHG